MSQLTIPNSFAPSTNIQSAPVNSNFTAVQTAVNSIDRTNMGSAGIDASSIIPSTDVAATFGTGTSSVGYTFLAGGTGAVPLTVAGVSSQTADLFDVTLTSGGTKAFYIDKSGVANVTQGQLFSQLSGGHLTPGTNQLSISVDSTGTAVYDNQHATGHYFEIAGSVAGQITTTAWTASGAIKAGYPVANSGVFTGDLSASRTTTSGALWLGGSSSAVKVDYGVTTSSTLTINANANGTGWLSAGSGTAASLTAGDLGASRSASTGALTLGGSSSSVLIDYGVTTASTLTVNKSFTGGLLVSATTGLQTMGSSGLSNLYTAEMRLAGTGGSGNYAVTTNDTGSPIMYFDHIGTSNTGSWKWRNGTNATTTVGTLSSGGTLTLTGAFASTAAATNTILQFPNDSSTTFFSSNVGNVVNTVAGNALSVTITGTALLSLNRNGNLGILGALSQTSVRAMKKNVIGLPTADALAAVRATPMYRYDLALEDDSPDGLGRHASFMADEADRGLAGPPGAQAAEPQTTAAYACAAVVAVDDKVNDLAKKVAALQAAIGSQGGTGSATPPPSV